MSFLEKLRQAQSELAEGEADPLRKKVEAVVRGMEAISTVALLDLLGMPKTTGNGRRLAPTMRALGFIQIKSRRFEPGGWRDSVTRGWARPIRGAGRRGVTVKPSHSISSIDEPAQQKDACHVQ